MWLSKVKCIAYGHQDRVRGDKQHVYLQCSECGRATTGWQLGSARQPYQHRATEQPVTDAA